MIRPRRCRDAVVQTAHTTGRCGAH
jgi:hypothetical protein